MTATWTRTLNLVRAGASGLLGETLPPELRYPGAMQLRYGGRRVAPEALAGLYRREGGAADIVIFLHGLMYDDTCWTAPRFNMTEAFRRDFGVFPVHVRYDTGRHVSENGEELSRLLDDWHRALGPVAARWHFVAHSMGGLVARSALHQAWQAGRAFTGRVDRVVLLAAPHRGAPLEKGAQLLQLLLEAAPHPLRLTARGLRILFENLRVGDRAPLAPVSDLTDFYVHTLPVFTLRIASRILPMRSDGIMDLRHGYLLREEWEGREAWGGMKPRKAAVPPLTGARYYALAGSLSRTPPTEPSARVLDGMVSTASAANRGEGDELRFLENGRYRLVPGVNHFVMPLSPEVYAVLSEWFSEPRAEEAAAGSRESQ